jgi:outer membrane protein assembly factor BamB
VVNYVYCLNAETGKEIWKSSFETSDELRSTPAIDGESVYAFSTEGVLLCLKSKNGRLIWKKDLVKEYDVVTPYYGFAASPAVEDDPLILTANTSG